MQVLYIRTSNIYDDSRATKEVLTLAEKGYKVHVIGWNRDGKAKVRSEEVFAKYKELISVDFFTCLIDGGIGLKNLDKLLKWVRWTNKVIRQKKDVDIIHVCNLDAALGVWKYAQKQGIKIVYDIYDYYIDSHSVPRVIEGLVERLETSIINAADATIICTEERKEQIVKSTPRCLTVIHNSPDVEKVSCKEIKYDYAYCGSLFGQRLLKEIFKEYPNHNYMRFAIAGYGEFANLVRDLDETYQSFHYFGSVSYEQVLDLESESRVISAIYEPTIRNHRLCAPNKFYEALALAKPVIVCRGTGIDKIIDANNAGIVIDYDSEQFFKVLEYLVNNPEICEEMGKNARRLYENEYKWEIMKERLIELYNEI